MIGACDIELEMWTRAGSTYVACVGPEFWSDSLTGNVALASCTRLSSGAAGGGSFEL